MKGILKIAVLVASVIALSMAGCTGGTDFVRADLEKLNYGVTTPNQVIQEFGKPWRENSFEANNSSVRYLHYSYGGPSAGARGQTFYFSNKVLVGYFFGGDLKGAGIDPELFSKVGLIQGGVTTRDQVEALLGKPGGMFIYPMTRNKNVKNFFYDYEHIGGFGATVLTVKRLFINYDAKGVVKDFKYTEEHPKDDRDLLF